jgi:hypothetical protein
MRLVTSPTLIIAILVGFGGTTQAQIPTINIDKTCRAAAGVTESLLGGDRSTERDLKMCLESEHKAREQIIKDHATYSSADKKQCIRSDVYLPSYVEWVTCLEMEKKVRDLRQELPETQLLTRPRARPDCQVTRRSEGPMRGVALALLDRSLSVCPASTGHWRAGVIEWMSSKPSVIPNVNGGLGKLQSRKSMGD